VRRLRRLIPALVGLGLAGGVLWQGGSALERTAEGHESFAVVVDEPAPVVALGDRSRPDEADAQVWRARVRPVSELERVELRLDGAMVEIGGTQATAAKVDAETGELALPLDALRRAPGWHFVELRIDRRGGRQERVVDPVLLGRFAAADAGEAKPCGATFTASAALVRGLLVPMLEDELLPVLRDNEHMGPDTVISKAELELRDDVVRFELVVEGLNTLAVSGIVSVAVVDERELHAELVTLGEVDFRGELRNKARGIGAGGGALVGGLITGPLAPVGAAAGFYLADHFVTKKARELVRAQIDAGLEQLQGIELLPRHVELVPGRPASRVAIGFCEQTGVREAGLVAGLWIQPDPVSGDGDDARFELGVAGPLDTAATPTIDPLGEGEDLRVELSIDVVNALLTEWTASGLLAELIGEQRALERANEELEAWTPLRLRGLVPTRPPTLTPAGGPEAGWAYGLGGLAVELDGVDEQPWGRVYVSAAGTLSPTWDAGGGELSLTGSLDRLELTCALPGPGGSQVLSGCFSEVLEAAEVRARIDERLRPGARHLPKLAARELLADELGVVLDDLELSRPRAGVLRLAASVRVE
jgi:hypothetical protein